MPLSVFEVQLLTASSVTAFHFAVPRPQRSAAPASVPSASHSSADIDRATDLVELDFLRKQVAEHEEEMQRCRVAHLMELDFLRQQVAGKGEEMLRCAADLAELDFLRRQVTEKEEEIQRCRAEVQRLVKKEKEKLKEKGEENHSNTSLESPQATLCTVKQRPHALRSAPPRPMKQTSQVSELGVVGRGLSHCRAMWALAQEERVRPLMLVNGLVGVFALIWVMFFMSWGGQYCQRRFIAGIQ